MDLIEDSTNTKYYKSNTPHALSGVHSDIHIPARTHNSSAYNTVTLTLRLLVSYIYIYIYIYIYMEHLFLMFLDHTQRRTTVGRTPLDE